MPVVLLPLAPPPKAFRTWSSGTQGGVTSVAALPPALHRVSWPAQKFFNKPRKRLSWREIVHGMMGKVKSNYGLLPLLSNGGLFERPFWDHAILTGASMGSSKNTHSDSRGDDLKWELKMGLKSTSQSTGNGHNGWKDKQNRPCDESRQPLPNKRPPGRCVWTLFSLIVLKKKSFGRWIFSMKLHPLIITPKLGVESTVIERGRLALI